MPQDQNVTLSSQSIEDTSVGKDERRRFIRAATILKARLLTDRGALDGTVLDASLNGVKVWTSGNIPTGTAVTLVLAGSVYFGGEVVWRSGETLGICFHDDPEKVASIMAALLPQRCLQVGHA
ncbi:PilZ domain-containing protein [Pelagibius litoralis]|uniref:PilZ domain-containing protein n=1 Tax=Pelagibius litoralis TaxID=374515 RepID=A0A967EZM4_9PROT|nr:PilZ domain-containing protein [Pelagibius litoralis]NIA70325.1 PilZ domain-containing protein [Pelagibius litoralis]